MNKNMGDFGSGFSGMGFVEDSQVALAVAKLNTLGYTDNDGNAIATGVSVFDEKFKEAVTKFQKQNNITPVNAMGNAYGIIDDANTLKLLLSSTKTAYVENDWNAGNSVLDMKKWFKLIHFRLGNKTKYFTDADLLNSTLDINLITLIMYYTGSFGKLKKPDDIIESRSITKDSYAIMRAIVQHIPNATISEKASTVDSKYLDPIRKLNNEDIKTIQVCYILRRLGYSQRTDQLVPAYLQSMLTMWKDTNWPDPVTGSRRSFLKQTDPIAMFQYRNNLPFHGWCDQATFDKIWEFRDAPLNLGKFVDVPYGFAKTYTGDVVRPSDTELQAITAKGNGLVSKIVKAVVAPVVKVVEVVKAPPVIQTMIPTPVEVKPVDVQDNVIINEGNFTNKTIMEAPIVPVKTPMTTKQKASIGIIAGLALLFFGNDK